MTNLDPNTNIEETSEDKVPIYLNSLRAQIEQLEKYISMIGTKQDSRAIRRRINLHSDVSLKLLRKIHVISSSNSQFEHEEEYTNILTEFERISHEFEEKVAMYPEEKIQKGKNDDNAALVNPIEEEEDDELVQLLDSFHEEDDRNNYGKWTTFGLLVGGSILGAAIGGPLGGYAFYTGCGSLAACLGAGIGGGALAGLTGTYSAKKLKKWTAKALKSIRSKQKTE